MDDTDLLDVCVCVFPNGQTRWISNPDAKRVEQEFIKFKEEYPEILNRENTSGCVSIRMERKFLPKGGC